MTRPERHSFKTLDAMRGVAALIVVIMHYGPTLGGRAMQYGFVSGYLAVDLFFVLSGFVIAHAYDDKLAAGLRLRDFLRLRFIRLAPMIWFGLGIGVVVSLIREVEVWRILLQGAAGAVFLPSPPGLTNRWLYLFPLNAVAWSLLFEVVANLAYAALFPVLSRRVLTVVVGVFAVALVGCAVAYGTVNAGIEWSAVWLAIARAGVSFFLGVLLCRTRAAWFSRVPRLPAWLVLLLVAAALFVPLHGASKAAYGVVFILVLSPLLVMAGAATEPRPRGVGLAATLAALSYPIYAIHFPILELARVLARPTGARLEVAGLVAIATLVPLSLLVGSFYETPLRRWLTGLSRRSATAA